jgi:hypothetical protein
MRRAVLLLAGLNLVVLAASAYAQTATPTPTPQKISEIYYSDVLDKLRFGKGKRRPDAEINAELNNELKSNKVFIVLDDHDRKELTAAGANAELIRTIDNALTEAEKKKVADEIRKIDDMNRLYETVLNNYRSTEPQNVSLAVKAAKEFIERFGNEERAKDIVTWLKVLLLRWEQISD